MAAPSFALIKEDPFQGIDARSPENQVPPGFLRDALNVDVVQGIARGRPGYAGYAGNFPVRVIQVDYESTADRVCFTLDAAVELSTIDLLNVRSSPIVVYGRLSANMGTGPFTTTDSAHYYPTFFQETRQTFLTGTHTLSVPATTHGLGSADIFVAVAESLSSTNLSNRIIEWDNINIDDSTFDIDIDYTNGTGSDVPVFTYYANKDPSTGSVYISGNTTVTSGSTTTVSILAATHQLANFNIIARMYSHNPSGGPYTDRDLVEPDSLTINTATGEVQYTITNGSPVSKDYFVILSAAPAANFKTGSLDGSTYTITINEPEKPFIFPGVYVSNGLLQEEVIPDEIEYDSVSNTISVTFQNPGANSFTIYWEYATIRSTQVCVTDPSVTASGTDSSPQLTLWGLDHTEIYGAERTARQGWANHIDSYRIAGESRVVGGQGGNLYSVQEFSEAGATYLYGSALPSLFQRLAATTILSPALWETGDNPGRTRGFVTGTALGDNWATCTNVEYDAVQSGGSVRYDLTIPALLLKNSAGTTITTNNTNINLLFSSGDQLTAENMSYSRHNGTFDIVHVEAGVSPNVVSIWVENSSVGTADWDDSGVTGSVGIFSDIVSLQSTSPFLPDDILLSDALTDSQQLTVVSSSDVAPTDVIVSGVSETITIQAGVQIVGRRTGVVMPLRTAADVASVDNFVRGDIVFYSGEDEPRPLRVEYVNPLADVTGSTITGDGVTATLTVGFGDTDHLAIGMSVLLRRAGGYTGEVVISDVPSQTTLTFSSTETDTVTTAVLVGETITIGEPITWEDTTSDTNTVQVDRRLIPIEAPDDDYTLTPSTHQRYFDANTFGDQPFLRSCMVADTLFLTDGDDEVFKFDGVSLLRAGLFKWQPGVFIQTDTASTAKIVTSLRSVAYTARSATKGQFTVAAADLNVLPVGTQIRVTTSTEKYTIARVDSTNNFIYVDRSLDAAVPATGTLSESATFRYYYRLNAVDINQNVIASAVSQSEDYSVELTEDAGIRHKLVGFPPWDVYDYDAIYVQAYRTKANTSAPFYRVFQRRLLFNGADGYIEFTDSFRDTNLLDLDPVNTALKGQELGVGWSEPLRAKCTTSAAGTTILGNVRDYPQLDIQLFGDSTVTATQLNGALTEFRRDVTDVAGITNTVDRVRYQFVDGTTNSTITGITGFDGEQTITAGNVAGTLEFGTGGPAHGLLEGDPVTFTSTGVLPGGVSAGVTYYVSFIGGSGTFRIATAPGGPSMTFVDAGTGTHTAHYMGRFQVSSAAHGLAVGNWIYIYWPTASTPSSANRPLNYTGWWQVYQLQGAGAFRIRNFYAIDGAAANFPTRFVRATNANDVPVLVGDPTTNPDGNSSSASANTTLQLFQAGRRLALAINASMRMTDTLITTPDQSDFVPWITALGGNDTGVSGRLLVRQPRVDGPALGMNLVTLGTNYSVFVNDVQRIAGATVSSQTALFPSRILIGYENFPEIFDNPTALLDSDSDSAVDINPADGQEVTTIVPFFGEAAFGAAQQSSVVVVFKENSIYLVDVNEKRAGRNPVQRIETEGVGCTAPNSVSVTKNGIMFANESGMYVLRRNLAVEYVGKLMERQWDRVDRDLLALAQGHHYTVGRKYKLSVPISGDLSASEVFVYDHTNEVEKGVGAWTRYDNHPTTGWCNLNQDAYFCSSTGRIYVIRRRGDEVDYQDDHAAYTFRLQLRANDFGQSGARKIYDSIFIGYRTAVPSEAQVGTAVDTQQEYTPVTGARIVTPGTSQDGFSDEVGRDVLTVEHNTSRRKGVSMSVQVETSTRLQTVEIASVEFRVASIGSGGVLQAVETGS